MVDDSQQVGDGEAASRFVSGIKSSRFSVREGRINLTSPCYLSFIHLNVLCGFAANGAGVSNI